MNICVTSGYLLLLVPKLLIITALEMLVAIALIYFMDGAEKLNQMIQLLFCVFTPIYRCKPNYNSVEDPDLQFCQIPDLGYNIQFQSQHGLLSRGIICQNIKEHNVVTFKTFLR